MVTGEITTRDCDDEGPHAWSLPPMQRKDAPDGSDGQPWPTHKTVSSVDAVALAHVSTLSEPPSGKSSGRLIVYACLGTVVSE